MITTVVSMLLGSIAAGSVQLVVGNIIKSTAPVGMKLVERAFTTLGSVIITGVITTTVMEPVDTALERAEYLWKKHHPEEPTSE